MAWGIGDLDAGQLPGTAALRGVQQGFGWKQLADGLDAVQESGFVCGAQEQGVRPDGEPVGLVSETAQLRVEKEAQLSVRGGGQWQPGDRGEEGAQKVCGALGPRGSPDGRVRVEGESARPDRELAGSGNEREVEVRGHGSASGAGRVRSSLARGVVQISP